MPAWLEVTVRSFAILAGLFLIAKLLGKKQLSKLSFFEYIVGITIGDIAGALSMQLEANLSQGITAIVIWTSIPVLINFLSLKNKKFRDFVEGKATIFIKDGKVMEDNLKSEQYTADELLEQLRKKDIFKLADVEFAVLESNGEISTLLKREHQPLTPHDMHVPTAPQKETQTVIMDGEILDEPLTAIGQNRGWLKTELEKIGVSIENVFLGQVDSFGQLTVDLYDDQLQMPAPKQQPLLLASIKKCQADLELFALATENNRAKKMYAENAVKLDAVLTKVQTILRN